MSLSLIEAEIRRFLSTSTSEVLCIKCKWGVGKIYGWRNFLDNAKRASPLALGRYSYASLFGLNSLGDFVSRCSRAPSRVRMSLPTPMPRLLHGSRLDSTLLMGTANSQLRPLSSMFRICLNGQYEAQSGMEKVKLSCGHGCMEIRCETTIDACARSCG